MTTKICRKCGVEKHIEDFYRQKTSSDGHGSYCKICNKAEAKKYVEREPERVARSYRKAKLRYKYGLSSAEFDEMVLKQNGLCAICSEDAPLSVDHCHSTGAVRGLLCIACNFGLGHFRDDAELLAKAIKYLE